MAAISIYLVMKKKHKVKPNFLIIGAAGTATASLTALIGQHPEGGFALGEQPSFFSNDTHYNYGWKKYLKLFEHCQGKVAVGDASTSYSRIRYHPRVVERIKEHMPRAKILYMVRHPLDRMVSAYVERMYNPTPVSFTSINDAVRRQPMIVDSSRYWEVFDAYRRSFEESQIKVIWFEDYVERTIEVFQDICRFLGMDDTHKPDMAPVRANPRLTPQERMASLGRPEPNLDTAWDEEARQWAIDQIREDNHRFLKHFGRPLDYWKGLAENTSPGLS